MSNFKDFLFADKKNDYYPPLLAPRGLLAVAIAFTILEGGGLIHALGLRVEASDITVENVIAAVNRERDLRNAPTLTTNDKLSRAADHKSRDMIARKYFSHTDPEGNFIWPAIVAEGYTPYTMLGENLAIDFTNTESMVTAWMNSPTHRENLLNTGFQDQGMGVAFGDANQGDYYSAVTNTFGTLSKKDSKPAPTPPVAEAQQPAPAAQPSPPKPAAPKPAPTPAPKPAPEPPKEAKEAPAPAISIISQTLEMTGTVTNDRLQIDIRLYVTGPVTSVTAEVGSEFSPVSLRREPPTGTEKSTPFAGTLTVPLTADLQAQTITVIAAGEGGARIEKSYPLSQISLAPSKLTIDQVLEAWLRQATEASTTAPAAPGDTAVAPPVKKSSFGDIFRYNRYFSLGFGGVFLIILLIDLIAMLRHQPLRWDKKANNIFILALSLLIVALLYWL